MKYCSRNQQPRSTLFLLVVLFLSSCKPGQEPTIEYSLSTSTSPKINTPESTKGLSTIQPTIELAPTQAEKWWNDVIFYEVFVRSFYDSDGDGVGDINGLIEKLDYLNDGDPSSTDDLGISGIWLMPITESPSYHGYDVIDYYTVDQEYGTLDDFKRFVDEAHQRGIYVIIDLVLNHSSSQHPWFLDSKDPASPSRDWYIWAENKPSYLGPWNQQVWHKSGQEYYYGVFWHGMPDYNLQNPEITQQLFDVTRFWLEEMKVDGFRLDAIKHLVEKGPFQENTNETHAWLQAFFNMYKTVNPQAFAVGEAWTVTSQVLDYTGDEVDIAFAFDLAEAIVNTAQGPLALLVGKEMTHIVENYPPGQYGTFITNHDQNRVMSTLKGDVTKAKIAATILLTSPGVPFIYYGEEIGMKGVKPDENIRRPMQWSGENTGAGMTVGKPWYLPDPDYEQVNLVNQVDDPDSLFNHYKALIHLRNEHAALRTGTWTLVDGGTPRLYTYLRHEGDDIFLVIMNVHTKALTADQYGLTLKSGPFAGNIGAVSRLGLDNPTAPEINPEGGFEGYSPFDEIPAGNFAVLQLIPSE